MESQQYKLYTKSNSKKIFAIMFALWLFVVMSISQIFVNNFSQNASAAGSGHWRYDIIINTADLGLSDSDYTTLKSAGWEKCTTYYSGNEQKFVGCIYYTVGSTNGLHTSSIDLPISILEKKCGRIQLSATISGVQKEYTSLNYTISGYSISDFPDKYQENTDEAYVLYVDVVKSKNTLNLTINFENIQYQGTSSPLYVFDNDTNKILSTNSVIQSATTTPIKIDFDDITTIRISLAVPYLWEIEWTNADSMVNKSAVVKVSGEVAISAKVKVINSYNNIIIV